MAGEAADVHVFTRHKGSREAYDLRFLRSEKLAMGKDFLCAWRNIIVRCFRRGFVEEPIDIARGDAVIEQDKIVSHRKFRRCADVLNRDRDLLTALDLKSGQIVLHFVIGLDRDLFGRHFRSARTGREGKEESRAGEGREGKELNQSCFHGSKLEEVAPPRIDPDQGFSGFPLATFSGLDQLGEMKCAALLLLAGLLLAGCGRSDPATEKGQSYLSRGIVRGFSPDRGEIEIQHETIPDYMPSMTMPFRPRSQRDIADLKVGDAIAFRLTVTRDDFWIDQIRHVGRDDVHVAAAKPTPDSATAAGGPRLKEGDEMPFFALTDEQGKQVTLDSFRGHPVILTFVFTRCPIPNFCPRISNNFAEVQRAIRTGGNGFEGLRLLSITLDPDFDTPAILKAYGEHLSFDPAVWTFATGSAKEIDSLAEAFSVYRKTEGGTLSHGLATALIDRDGSIRRIWRGNAWTPEEVLAELKTLN